MNQVNLRNSDWPAEDPEKVGLEREKLTALDSVIRSGYGNISGIVVVRNGAVAFERYYHGLGPEYAGHVASVTKSVLSALIGIAVQDGYLKQTQRVLDFFPEYTPDSGQENITRITVRHLLSMTAPYPFTPWQEPLEQLCTSPDWVRFTLRMLGRGGSIGAFQYSTAGAHLLSVILSRCTGKSARQFANERLFTPIGMRVIPDNPMEAFGYDELFGKKVRGWVTDPAGNSTGGWGLTLTPRDMARFGLLYLNKGSWRNRQIVPEAWVEESTVPHSDTYGYLWWLIRENGLSAYAAMGDGGNLICCIPEKDLVVAILSEVIQNPRDRWTLVKEHILPVIKEL